MLHKFLAEQQKDHGTEIAVQNLLLLCLPHMMVRVIAHQQNQKDITEGLPCRQGIRIVHSMPDKFQNIRRKAQQQKSRKRQSAELFTDGKTLIHDIHRHKHQHRTAAVDIWPVVKPSLRINADTMSRKHIQHGKIGFHLLREIHIPEIRLEDRTHLGYQQNCRHSARQQGKGRKPADAAKNMLPLCHQKQSEIKDKENADHDREIIIRKNRKGKRQAVKTTLPFLHQPFQPEND